MIRRRKIKDYVEIIYTLQEQGAVRGTSIAKVLNVSKPTVSVTLKTLEQEGYIRMREDRTVMLTAKGMRIAEEVIERSRVISRLLTSLGVDEETVAEDARNMEHAISQKSFLALMSFVECRSKAEESQQAEENSFF